MFVVSFLAFFPSELPFKFMDSYVNTLVSIFAGLGSNKNLAVFASCDYLHAGAAAPSAVDNYLDLIDAVVVLGEF